MQTNREHLHFMTVLLVFNLILSKKYTRFHTGVFSVIIEV